MSDNLFSMSRLRQWIREGKKLRRKANKKQTTGAAQMFQTLEGRQLFSVGVDTPLIVDPDVLFGQIATVADLDGAEISAYDATTQRIFITGEDAGGAILQVYDLSDPRNPTPLGNITLSSIGDAVQSVAAYDGMIAAAISEDGTNDGHIAFFDASDFSLINSVDVGNLPNMVTFTHDGTKLLVANEGEQL